MDRTQPRKLSRCSFVVVIQSGEIWPSENRQARKNAILNNGISTDTTYSPRRREMQPTSAIFIKKDKSEQWEHAVPVMQDDQHVGAASQAACFMSLCQDPFRITWCLRWVDLWLLSVNVKLLLSQEQLNKENGISTFPALASANGILIKVSQMSSKPNYTAVISA